MAAYQGLGWPNTAISGTYWYLTYAELCTMQLYEVN